MEMVNTCSIAQVNEDEFISTLNRFLLPSSPIRREELLRGRGTQLDDIKKALACSGRHVFVHGDRGVGKTSVAQTAAYLYQSTDGDPVLVGCDAGMSFYTLAKSIADNLVKSDPTLKKRVSSYGAKAGGKYLSVEMATSLEKGEVPTPTSVDAAVALIRFAASAHSRSPVVVVDEFERMTSLEDKALFGDFVKQISDQSVPIKLILCGVGESLTDLLGEHESCFRYLASIFLPRLGITPLMEIVEAAAVALGVEIDDYFLRRMAMISDGFPHYIHLIGIELFWSLFNDEDVPTKVAGKHFGKAINEAVNNVEPHLKKIYEQATQKYNDDYEYVLWALAYHSDPERRSTEVYESLGEIMEQLGLPQLDRGKFNNRNIC